MKYQICIVGLALNASVSMAQIDSTAPYINVKNDCKTENLANPEGHEYRYLYSKDCRVIHVLPPSVRKQEVSVSELAAIGMCPAFLETRDSLNSSHRNMRELKLKKKELEDRLLNSDSKSERQSLERKISLVQGMIESESNETKKIRNDMDINYSNVPAARFNVLLDSSIKQSELNKLRANNLSTLYPSRTEIERVVDQNGNPVLDEQGRPKTIVRNIVDPKSLRPATISSSLYSFTFKKASPDLRDDGLYSSTIPALEELVQEGTQTNTVHVRANGAVSGDIVMSLNGVCEHVIQDENGNYRVDLTSADSKSFTNSIFTVNQTMEVQQIFAQGYEATLKIDNVVDMIVDQLTTHTENGFQKSSTFGSFLNAKVNELVEFNWTTEVDPKTPKDIEKIMAVKKEVTAVLIDDYIDKLVKLGVLKIQEPSNVTPAEGGYVNESRVANRCWTERKGGLGGLFGGRRQVCSDYTYTVAVWKDGITKEELKQKFNLSVQSIDRMTINTPTPTYFTTTFRN